MDLKEKVAVVTGASTGIGAATVKTLLNIGMKVVGFARRKELIENLVENHKGKLFARCVDVTKSQEILNGFDWVTKNVGPIHVLINNAGISRYASILSGNLEDWKQIMDTNFMSIAIGCKEAIKVMREHKIDGYIININSIHGYYDCLDPNSIMYTSSKYASRVMTENIRLELAEIGSNIRITNLAPGLVKTDIVESGYGKDLSNAVYKNLPFIFAEDVADTIVYLLSAPPRINISEMLVRPIGEIGTKISSNNYLLK
ncbi:farnesol dehydrogenase-like [Onthophagus taurus]|uniref:farnesol dehydrogenase-like n=1 Tax=Onthophagus taurus TaxID=166361 RepID=UPI000C1FE475|nr:farnesol dehydrogenase-like [Onthophagus taurus]